MRGRNRTSRLIGAAGFSLAGVVAVATLAQAAGGSKATIDAAKFRVDSFETREAFTSCGGGKRAVGGGVVQEGELEFDYQLQASAPARAGAFPGDTADGDVPKDWYGALRGASDGNRARVFAICARVEDATVEATDFSVTADGDNEGFAQCPDSRTAIGGGIAQVEGSPEPFEVQASGPLDGSGTTLNTNDGDVPVQWYASVHNEGGLAQDARVFAICADVPKARIEAEEFEVSEFSEAKAVAKCPGDKRVLGGGVVQDGDPSSVAVLTSGPVDSSGKAKKTNDGDVPTRWYAGVTHYQAGTERTFRAFAVCMG